jgi:hypothetical protein
MELHFRLSSVFMNRTRIARRGWGMKEKLRNSVIELTEDTELIKNIPWGIHFCQFFSTKEELMEITIPYFKEGLEQNELCQWRIFQTSDVEEAKEALRKGIPDFDFYLKKGQIKIILYTHEGDIRAGAKKALSILRKP